MISLRMDNVTRWSEISTPLAAVGSTLTWDTRCDVPYIAELWLAGPDCPAYLHAKVDCPGGLEHYAGGTTKGPKVYMAQVRIRLGEQSAKLLEIEVRP